MKEHECKFIDIAEKVMCQGNEHLESFFQDVIDKGGEGIILRDPQSFLQPGRSPSYLKHKVLLPFHSLPPYLTWRGPYKQQSEISRW